MVRLANSDISFSNIESSIDKFRTHINNVKKMVNIEENYELEDIKPEEKVIAGITRGNIEENLKSIDEINRKMNKEILRDSIEQQIPELHLDDATLDDITNQYINIKNNMK